MVDATVLATISGAHATVARTGWSSFVATNRIGNTIMTIISLHRSYRYIRIFGIRLACSNSFLVKSFLCLSVRHGGRGIL